MIDILDGAQAHITDLKVQGLGSRAEKALCGVREGDIELAEAFLWRGEGVFFKKVFDGQRAVFGGVHKLDSRPCGARDGFVQKPSIF